MNAHFALRQLNQLIQLAGTDQWHNKPLYFTADLCERVVKVTENDATHVTLWLENGDTVSADTDTAYHMIWSCVEQFAQSEDEILEWLGQ